MGEKGEVSTTYMRLNHLDFSTHSGVGLQSNYQFGSLPLCWCRGEGEHSFDPRPTLFCVVVPMYSLFSIHPPAFVPLFWSSPRDPNRKWKKVGPFTSSFTTQPAHNKSFQLLRLLAPDPDPDFASANLLYKVQSFLEVVVTKMQSSVNYMDWKHGPLDQIISNRLL